MSDDDAFQVVDRDRDGEYCPKSVWKQHCEASGDGGLAQLRGRTITSVQTLEVNRQHKREKQS